MERTDPIPPPSPPEPTRVGRPAKVPGRTALTRAVDAVGRVTGETRPPGLHGAEDPREFRSHWPGDYLDAAGRPRAVEPFQRPELLVPAVNPLLASTTSLAPTPYSTNCADCARVFEAAWRGHADQAAGLLLPDGEPSPRTQLWAGEAFSPVSAAQVLQALERGGHGSSALVHSRWGGWLPGGHAYNVVNHHGEILTVDSQVAAVYAFAADTIHPTIDSLDLRHVAMVWDTDGRRLL